MKITHARKGDARSGVIFTIPEKKWGLLVVYGAVRQSRNITFVLIPISSVETSLCHREAGEREKKARGDLPIFNYSAAGFQCHAIQNRSR